MANIKSQIKRNRQNEKARLRNKAVKSSLKTAVRKFREAAEQGNAETAAVLLRDASRKLDKAASKGVIHKNQAANRKSAIAKRVADTVGRQVTPRFPRTPHLHQGCGVSAFHGGRRTSSRRPRPGPPCRGDP